MGCGNKTLLKLSHQNSDHIPSAEFQPGFEDALRTMLLISNAHLSDRPVNAALTQAAVSRGGFASPVPDCTDSARNPRRGRDNLWVQQPLAHLDCVTRKHGAEMPPLSRAWGP